MPLLPNEQEALRLLKFKLREKYELLELRLYGSKATGTDVKGSDLDVMTILKHVTPEIESEIDDLIFELNLKYDCLITALYFSRKEIDMGHLSESPVYKKALSEGIAL